MLDDGQMVGLLENSKDFSRPSNFNIKHFTFQVLLFSDVPDSTAAMFFCVLKSFLSNKRTVSILLSCHCKKTAFI